ncbi:hypothetical protein DRJ22_03535 [Candidatus Woesearchaeota archaeon]|nr:MAG: hypothetical protein DRJ22_03535 [Candidatus Woesearchaeota archaeon]
MADFNIFRIEYNWYEGEHSETLVGKEVSIEEFEKDLIKAKQFAESLIGKKIKSGEYLGRGYRVECLLEFYEQILWCLTEKLGYIYCYYKEDIYYDIDDLPEKKIQITKFEKKIEKKEIRDKTDTKN